MERKKEIKFVKTQSAKDVKEVFDFNIDAFSDSPDFKWTLEDIKKELKDDWNLFSVNLGNEVIGAAFYKFEKKILYCKNTSIKMFYHGSGYSHCVMSFFDSVALELKASKIVHYCSIDNFRQYSLNESNGLKKTSNKLGVNGHTTEWVKTFKKR